MGRKTLRLFTCILRWGLRQCPGRSCRECSCGCSWPELRWGLWEMPHLPELIPRAARGHTGVLRTLLLSGLHFGMVKGKIDGLRPFTSLIHKDLVHIWSLILYSYSTLFIICKYRWSNLMVDAMLFITMLFYYGSKHRRAMSQTEQPSLILTSPC